MSKITELMVPRKTAILVLGMHRSGTSALTRVLSLLGCQLPQKLFEPRSDNPTGYWESADLVPIHDQILDILGLSWHHLGLFADDWFHLPRLEQHRKMLINILERDFQNSSIFVIKDPRMSRNLNFWVGLLKQFSADVRIIICLRNPLEVAASLKARNSFSLEKSLLLWLLHTLEAERSSRKFLRSIVTFEGLLGDWQATIDMMAEDLDISWPIAFSEVVSEISDFLSDSLRHHIVPDKNITTTPCVYEWVVAAYQAMNNIKDKSSREETQRNIDALYAEIGKSFRIFENLLSESDQRLQSAYERLARKDKSINELNYNFEERLKLLAEKEIALEKHKDEMDTLQQVVAQQQGKVSKQDNWIVELKKQLVIKDEALDKYKDEVDTLNRLAAKQRLKISSYLNIVTKQKKEFALIRKRLISKSTEVNQLTSVIDNLRSSRLWRFLKIVRLVTSFRHLLNPDNLKTYKRVRESASLDTSFYLAQNRDVFESGLNPTLHYIIWGVKEGGQPQSCSNIGNNKIREELGNSDKHL